MPESAGVSLRLAEDSPHYEPHVYYAMWKKQGVNLEKTKAPTFGGTGVRPSSVPNEDTHTRVFVVSGQCPVKQAVRCYEGRHFVLMFSQ